MNWVGFFVCGLPSGMDLLLALRGEGDVAGAILLAGLFGLFAVVLAWIILESD